MGGKRNPLNSAAFLLFLPRGVLLGGCVVLLLPTAQPACSVRRIEKGVHGKRFLGWK